MLFCVVVIAVIVVIVVIVVVVIVVIVVAMQICLYASARVRPYTRHAPKPVCFRKAIHRTPSNIK
jgi:hypothetical protein